MEMKKIAVLMTLVLMLCAMPLTAFAAQPAEPYAASNPPATPNWSYTASIISSLHYYDGSTMYCSTSVTGLSSVTSITVEQTLQKQGALWIWSKYDGDSVYTATEYDCIALVTNEKIVVESGKYRLKSVVTVKTASGKSEKITVYSETLEI